MSYVCLDFETHLLKAGLVTPKPVCLAWFDDDGPGLFVEKGMLTKLRTALESDAQLIGHNIAYDLGVACAEWPELIPAVFQAYESGRIRCTKVRQNLIDIARGECEFRRRSGKITKASVDLATLADYYLGEHLEKEDTWRLRYGELDGVPLAQWPEDAKSYPLGDVWTTCRIFEAQAAAVREMKWGQKGIPDEARQTRSDWKNHLRSAWGIRTHGQTVSELQRCLEDTVSNACFKLMPTGMINAPGSKTRKNMKVIQDRIILAYGQHPPLTSPSKRYPNGQVKTSSDVLLASGDPSLILLGNVMEQMSHLDNFVPMLLTGTRVPICPRYKILVTGRVGASNPNLLNMPREGGVRECFIPRRGFVFVSCDYDTIELRALAQVCKDNIGYSKLAEAFQRGADPHLEFAAQLMGITNEEATVRYKGGDVEVASQRQLAKVANFGFPGGLSAEKFVKYAHGYDEKLRSVVDSALAQRLREAWFDTWKEMKPYFDWIGRQLGPAGGTIFQARSGRVRGDVFFTEAANGFFQSLTADGANDADWRATRECYIEEDSPLYGCRIPVFLYDEMIIEAPEHRAHAAAERLATVMREEMEQWLPDVPITCAPAMMRRWFKGCKPVFVDGELVPARPVKKDGKVTWVHDRGENDVAHSEAA